MSTLGKINLVQKTLSEKLLYAVGGTSKATLVLAPNTFTTELQLLVKANITTLAAVLKENPLIKLMKTFTVKGTSQDYVTITNPIALASLIKVRGKFQQEDTIAGSATADYYASLPIHFGLGATDNPMDISAVLPDNIDTSLLQVEVQWGVAADLGTGVTINSAEISVVQRYVTLTPMQIGMVFPAGVRVPKVVTDVKDISSLQSNLGMRFDPVVKTLMNKTIFAVVDSNGAVNNSQITAIGVINNVRNEQLLNVPYRLAVQQNMISNNLLTIPTGIACIQWGDIPGGTPDVGLDTRPLASGELQVGATVEATGGKVYLVHISLGRP